MVGQNGAGQRHPVRLGGVGQVVAERLADLTGLETRVTVLGHLQGGVQPP